MELNQLDYFKAVAETENITKAAQRLRISQPSLSKTIARLEEDVGVSLFDRQPNTIRLNDCGRAFLKRVDNILLEIQDARKELNELSTGDSGQIRFAATVPEMLNSLIETYLTNHPKVRMHQIQATPELMLNMLQYREIDFALSNIPLIGQSIQWTPIITEKIGAIISKNNPLSDKKTLSFEDLKAEQFIVNSNVEQQRMAQSYFGSMGFLPNVFFEGTQPELIGALVSKNCGVGFATKQRYETLKKLNTNENIVYCDIEPPLDSVIGIAVLQDHYLSPAAKGFYQYLLKYSKWTQRDIEPPD
jgi:DNA-binding transcriptional LysR family regulator